MTKMAEGFKAIRQAELELAGEYRAQEHDEFFKKASDSITGMTRSISSSNVTGAEPGRVDSPPISMM